MINKYIIKYYNINDIQIGGSGSSSDNEIPCSSLYYRYFILTLQSILEPFMTSNNIKVLTSDKIAEEFKYYKRIDINKLLSLIRGYAFSINTHTNEVKFINNPTKLLITKTNISDAENNIGEQYTAIINAYKEFTNTIIDSYTPFDKNQSITDIVDKYSELINTTLINYVNTIDNKINNDNLKGIYKKFELTDINESLKFEQIIDKITPSIENFRIIDKNYKSKKPDCIIELWQHKTNKSYIIRILDVS